MRGQAGRQAALLALVASFSPLSPSLSLGSKNKPIKYQIVVVVVVVVVVVNRSLSRMKKLALVERGERREGGGMEREGEGGTSSFPRFFV